MTQKTLILALETSSRIGSVAIASGKKMLEETTFSAPLRHSAEIFPAIGSILNRFGRKPEQIEQVHISIGPGSFTGLRIATTLAKALHLANKVKIVTADTLDVIAANTIQNKNHERIATILDAKRGQFFIAVYQRLNENTMSFLRNLSAAADLSLRESGEQESTSSPLSAIRYPLIKLLPDSILTAHKFLDQFAQRQKPIWLLGDGLLYYKDKFKAQGVHFFDEKFWSPKASNVHLICWKKALADQFDDPLTLTPNYILRPDIKVKTR